MGSRLSYRTKGLLFVALSLADLALTLWLIESTGGQAYEANPVAAEWQIRFGNIGLALFKGTMVFAVLGLTAYICRHRPRLAGRVLEVGCASLIGVIVYSGLLVHAAIADSWRLPASEEEIEAAALAANFRQQQAFLSLERELCADLLAGTRTLREAADRLADSEKGRDPEFHKILKRVVYANGGDSERLAAYLIRSVVVSQRHSPQLSNRVAKQLEEQFVQTYVLPAPVAHRPYLRNSEFEHHSRNFVTYQPKLRPVPTRFK